ncbi:MAG: ssDNA-binding domain-containing protein [Chitinophagales bacterium]|nr:ssDNA-binding domain-containing protein [Chitinophagales bacterium]
MNNTTTEKRDVYTIVTDRIIELLKQGTIPWKKPWAEAGIPQNLISRRVYRGLNVMLLASLGYEQNYFLTYSQIKELGASVKKDEKSYPVVYWNWVEPKQEEGEILNSKKYPFLRYYNVYNVAQCTGIPPEKIPVVTRQAYPIQACEHIIENMPSKPKITQKEAKAYYNPLLDFINMPKMGTFSSNESYYATLFHELVHSTGHLTRLNRKGLLEMTEFGSPPYSFEELVAEIGACYLESLTGIAEKQIDNNVAYISGWLDKLENDDHFIVLASSQAQKAVDYILGQQFEVKEEMAEQNGVE